MNLVMIKYKLYPRLIIHNINKCYILKVNLLKDIILDKIKL